MKYLTLLFTTIVLVVALAPKTALASVLAECGDGAHTTTFWKLECTLTVVNEPDIPAVTMIKAKNSQFGTWWQNGIIKGFLGPAVNEGTDTIVRENQGGSIFMYAEATGTTLATRFFLGNGITWDKLCAYGEFFGFTGFIWEEDASLRDDFCDIFSTE